MTLADENLSQTNVINTRAAPYYADKARIAQLEAALRELVRAIEAKADIGKRRAMTISATMEYAIIEANLLLKDANKDKL